jgi:hypothetical protein
MMRHNFFESSFFEDWWEKQKDKKDKKEQKGPFCSFLLSLPFLLPFDPQHMTDSERQERLEICFRLTC